MKVLGTHQICRPREHVEDVGQHETYRDQTVQAEHT